MPALNLTRRPAPWRLALALAFSLAGCAAPVAVPSTEPATSTAPAALTAITLTPRPGMPSPAPTETPPPASTPTASADTATPAPRTAGACPAFAAGPPAEGWTQLAGNPQRTGYSPDAPVEPWRVRWIWNGPGADGRPAPDHLRLPQGVQPVAGDGRLYLGHADGIVRALSAETGAMLWESPSLENAVVNTAAYDPATASVYVGTTDGRFWRLDAASGAVLRSNRPGGSLVMAPLVVGGLVFIGSTSGAFYAFDAATLEQRWLYEAGAPLVASAAFAVNEGGLIVLLAEDGTVHAVCAADGARLWRTAVGGDADPLRGGARFPDTYPVVAEASGVALVRAYQAWDKMWQPEGGAPADAEATRQFLEANPEYQSFFVLNLRDGSPRFTAPVLAGAIGNGGDFESTPPQAVVRAYPDGAEAAYLLWRNRQACVGGFCDGREDTTLGELDLVSGVIRFVQDHKNAGSLRLLGHETTGLSSPRRSALRADHLGFVFQGFHLLNEFDVLENVVMAARCARRGLTAARANARRLLTEVGLEARAHAAIATLSGGERQRAALARALLLKPRLLLADEPTGNLDPATAALVLDQMLALARGHGSAVLIVTHDTQVAGRADRRLVLRDGRLHPE